MESNLENISEIFKKIQNDGWDIVEPLKWGFFFISFQKDDLKKIEDELLPYNYSLEEIHRSNEGYWVLQLSKTEKLIPEKLHSRNISFNELASRYDCEYDGWDVGKT